MAHTRTKRKPTQKNIIKLFLAIVFVFILVGFFASLPNLTKNTFKIPKMNVANTASANNDDNPWTLHGDGLLLTNDGHEVFVEIVNDEASREQGLSGKDILKVYYQDKIVITEGMLFEFPDSGVRSFWMKDMNFDLDIIFMDENYKIVKIFENAKANSYNKDNPNTSQVFANDENSKAKYVLEINSGLSNKMNLKVGDIFNIQ